MASTTTASSATEVRILQETIETALAQKGRHYSSYLTFAWRFEADSSADKDTAHFQTILELLGLPRAVELVIKKDDTTPGLKITGLLVELLNQRLTMPDRCLLIGHYAGYGSLIDDVFYFTSPLDQRFSYEGHLQPLMDRSQVFPNTDCILILDSCFSGTATRCNSSSDSSGELVSSVGYAEKTQANWSYRARFQDKTFTSRLAEEVAREVDRRATDISLTNLIANLRKTSSVDSLPEYQLQAGNVGIRIPNLRCIEPPAHCKATQQQGRQASLSSPASPASAGLSPAIPHSRSSTADLSVIFQVHVNNVAPEGIKIEQMVAWVQSLNRDFDLELMGVFKSRSTVVVLFSGPYYLWAQVNGLPGFSFLGEVFGRNLLKDIRHRAEIRPGPS